MHKDRTGQRMGRLVAVSFSRIRITSARRKKVYWNCICDCGNNAEVEASNFKVGHTLSCGCLLLDKAREKAEHSGAAFGTLWNDYRQKARKTGIKFLLTKEELKQLTSSDCYYCGEKPSRIRWSTSKREKYTFNGVDRKDGGDYTLINSVPCCWDCNEMKSDRSHEEFLDKIKRIYAKVANSVS